jgi:predicted amidophosphoribosyltransferase
MLEALLDLLFPHRCPACDALAAGGPGFCPPCAAALVPASLHACPRCGVPVHNDGPPLPCADCREHPPPFSAAAAAFLFGGPLADAVARYKGGSVPELPEIVAPALADAARRTLASPTGPPRWDFAVAVPPDPVRLARRGFDPGTLVAAAAARRLGLRLARGLLLSVPRPRSQRTLDRAERLRSLRHVFSLARGVRERLCGRHVLLLDDVRTTGSTITACARVLRTAGAASVRVATLALVE